MADIISGPTMVYFFDMVVTFQKCIEHLVVANVLSTYYLAFCRTVRLAFCRTHWRGWAVGDDVVVEDVEVRGAVCVGIEGTGRGWRVRGG